MAVLYKQIGKQELAAKFSEKVIEALSDLNVMTARDAQRLVQAYEFRCQIGGVAHRLKIIDYYKRAIATSLEHNLGV